MNSMRQFDPEMEMAALANDLKPAMTHLLGI
jgi:hypothetical protein